MAAWSCLPPEIKLHVIRKLDFMSRKSLRCTSFLDRKLVDSLIFKLPRVRFGYKKGRCLIVIYTGIEKFLRWEMEMGDDGIINYHRSENTFDPEFFVKTQFENLHPKFPNAFMLASALIFLTGLVAHESIQIKTMEWELSSEGLSEEEKDMARNVINLFVETNTFRVEEIVFPKNNDDSFSCIVGTSENIIGLKSFRRLGIIVSGESLVPQVAHDFIWKNNDRTTWYETTLDMVDNIVGRIILMQKNLQALEINHERDCPSRSNYRSARLKFETEKVQSNYVFVNNVDDMIVSHVAESKCGFTTQKMHATYENEFIEEFDIKKCGLGDLCKRCADPFDYWYTQNLPRRFHYEPFWNGILDQSTELNRDEDLEMVLLKVKLEKYEKEKARIQKIVDAKRGKVGGAEGGQWSWGFDAKKCQGLYFGAKKTKKSKTTEPEVMIVPGEITAKSVDAQFDKSFMTEEVKVTAEISTVTQETIMTKEDTVTKQATVTQVPTVPEDVKEPLMIQNHTVTHEPTVTQDDSVPEDAKEPTVTQIPTLTEEDKEPLMIQESKATLEATETIQTPSLLKYLLVLIVIPIALAIIFAFF